MPKNGRRYEPEVLQNGHADRIPVEAVEKSTDNSSARPLCCYMADADSPVDRPSLAPALSPIPLPALGPMTISTENKELNRLRMIDMSFPLSHSCIGEEGQDADELLGGQNPGKWDDVGRHGAPT
jgi:hypothetical protein